MLTVTQACNEIFQRVRQLPKTTCPLEQSLGRIIAADIHSDVDSPPFDKSLVDGFAILCRDLQPGVRLQVNQCVLAGQTPSKTVTPGTATQIMTGAPIPDGADAVIMVEDCELDPESRLVTIHGNTVTAGNNIMRRATSLAAGEAVIGQGCHIRPVEVGIMAEIGCADVPVYSQPTVGIISTGDELVAVEENPSAGQIRNSNGSLLSSLVTACGAAAYPLGIARDNEPALKEKIQAGLEYDVLLLSGGVSAGMKDLVPAMLEQLQVAEVFHKVQLKPGKPLWFGVANQPDQPTLVFGLPGNPVSSLVCYLLFVAPTLALLQHNQQPPTPEITGYLTTPFTLRGSRPTYHPAQSQWDNGKLTVRPLLWKGSADQKTVSAANCLAFFQPPARVYDVGEPITLFPFPW